MGQPEFTPGPMDGVRQSCPSGSSPSDDVRLSMAGLLGLTLNFFGDGGGALFDLDSSSPIDTPESRGLNRLETTTLAVSNASCNGLTSSKIGGSAGEKADTGGVRVADIDAREELELEKSGSGPRLPGERDSARPDFWPKDREIDDEAAWGRLW